MKETYWYIKEVSDEESPIYFDSNNLSDYIGHNFDKTRRSVLVTHFLDRATALEVLKGIREFVKRHKGNEVYRLVKVVVRRKK